MTFQDEVIQSFQVILKENKTNTLVFYVEIDELWNDDYQVSLTITHKYFIFD